MTNLSDRLILQTPMDATSPEDRQLWPHSREAEWAISGAVFGLTAAFIQILVRSLVEENDEVDRVDNGQYGFAGGNRFRDNYIDHWGRDSQNLGLFI